MCAEQSANRTETLSETHDSKTDQVNRTESVLSNRLSYLGHYCGVTRSENGSATENFDRL